MKKTNYVKPTVEISPLPLGLHLLASMSIEGNIFDYEEGGDYEAIDTNENDL